MNVRKLTVTFLSILLLSLLPVQVFAADYVKPVPETVTTTEVVTVMETTPEGYFTTHEEEITHRHRLPLESVLPKLPDQAASAGIEQNGSWYYITTFADLQELAKGSYSEYTGVEYQGNEPLVISADISLPKNLHLNCYDGTVIVNKGVTFRTVEYLSVGTFTVKGTAHVSQMQITKALNVSGKLYASGNISMLRGAEISGAGNISFAGNWETITFSYDAATTKELTAAVTVAKNATNPRFRYLIYADGDLVINKNVTIPENCELHAYSAATVTVNAGCTLTVDYYMYLCCPTAIKGTLKNNGQVTVYPSGSNGAKLDFSSGGGYKGTGSIVVYNTDTPFNYIKGLENSDFDAEEYWDYDHYWLLHYNVGLKRLAKPSKLTWGTVYRDTTWNEEIENYNQEAVKLPGAFSFQPNRPNFGNYLVRIYKDGGTTPYTTVRWGMNREAANVRFSAATLNTMEIASGEYTFKVMAEGDYESYRNSLWVTSDTWKYTKPSKKVGKCSNLRWEYDATAYDGPSAYVGGYQAQFFYSSTKNGTPVQIGTLGYFGGEEMIRFGIGNYVGSYGDGYYYYKVRALSSDMNVRLNGEYSELSPAYHYVAGPTLSVKNRASDGKPSLSWTAVKNVKKYEVYRSATGKSGSFKKIASPTKTSFVNTGAETGKLYYYRVRAILKDGTATWFGNMESTRCDLPRPNVTATNVAGSGKIKLSWKKIEGAVKYEVYRATSQNGKYTKLGSTTKLSYTNTSAKAGTKYWYKVKAIHEKSGANSAFSQADGRMCDLARPTVTLKLNSNGKPKISWKKVEGAVKYEIYRGAYKDGTYKKIKTTTSLSFTDTNAYKGNSYYYKVKAIHSNTNANSAFSLPKYIKAK